MADSFLINLSTRGSSSLTMSGYNNGATDPNIYMRVSVTRELTLVPGEEIRACIVPSAASWSASDASGFLVSSDFSNNLSSGIYTLTLTNNDINDLVVNTGYFGDPIKLTIDRENTSYDLFWVQKFNSTATYSGLTTGIYTYPHNLLASETTLLMEPISSGKVRYTFTFPEVTNSGAAAYTGAHQPYQAGFFFGVDRYHADIASGTINGVDCIFAEAGTTSGFAPSANTGLVIELPLYDPRTGLNQIPANYKIYLGYHGVSGLVPSLLTIDGNHFRFLNDIVPRLDTQVATSLNINKLQRVGEVEIEKGVIERKRLSIGIKDIAVHENIYEKQGYYVSPRYTNENGIYTFSLRVREFIPNYPNVDPYSVVKYFAEFNGQDWIPISPSNRGTERNAKGEILPKLLIFDQDPGDMTEGMKYLSFTSDITSFRIKIVFDITGVDGIVISPEVRDYRCIIFDKQQLLEL